MLLQCVHTRLSVICFHLVLCSGNTNIANNYSSLQQSKNPFISNSISFTVCDKKKEKKIVPKQLDLIFICFSLLTSISLLSRESLWTMQKKGLKGVE